MARRGRPLLLATALLACGRAGSPAAATATPAGEAWPEADALFHQDPRWLGADVASSVDLGGGRVLWLFGDTFVSTSPANVRSASTMVRNTLAVQAGYDPSRATIAFHWGTAGASPTAFFPGVGADWFWPGHGAMVDGRLVVFLSRVASSSGGLGFQAAGWAAVRIDNPAADPSAWQPVAMKTPASTMGVTFGEALVVSGGYLYAFGAEDVRHAVHLIRFPTSAVATGDLSSPEWWSAGAWAASASVTTLPAPLFADGATELSVQPAPGGQGWLSVQAVGFGAATLDVRSAPGFTGPWGALSVVYTPPESSRPNVLVYAGKGHPELTGAPLVATYASNSASFAALVADTTLYYPRFVRIGRGAPPDR